MAAKTNESSGEPSAGYTALATMLGLQVIPNRHASYVAPGRRIDSSRSAVREAYPATYWPGDDLGDPLEFALKYDGVKPHAESTLTDPSARPAQGEHLPPLDGRCRSGRS